jgi:hypothetical protein
MRPLWFVAGTAAGVYATAKVRRAAESLTVDGVHDRLTGWFAGARVLREELRAGMTEKETELRHRIDAVPDGGRGPRQLPAGGRLENRRDDH